jgi:hypothetical protein
MITGEPLPLELVEFLMSHIDSIAQLEALLLLRRTPDVRWSAAEMAKRLYISEPDALQILTHLEMHDCLGRHDEKYMFQPRSEELSRMIELVAEYYATQLIPMTNLIHAKPRRIRQFADAFKLRKD